MGLRCFVRSHTGQKKFAHTRHCLPRAPAVATTHPKQVCWSWKGPRSAFASANTFAADSNTEEKTRLLLGAEARGRVTSNIASAPEPVMTQTEVASGQRLVVRARPKTAHQPLATVHCPLHYQCKIP